MWRQISRGVEMDCHNQVDLCGICSSRKIAPLRHEIEIIDKECNDCLWACTRDSSFSMSWQKLWEKGAQMSSNEIKTWVLPCDSMSDGWRPGTTEFLAGCKWCCVSPSGKTHGSVSYQSHEPGRTTAAIPWGFGEHLYVESFTVCCMF